MPTFWPSSSVLAILATNTLSENEIKFSTEGRSLRRVPQLALRLQDSFHDLSPLRITIFVGRIEQELSRLHACRLCELLELFFSCCVLFSPMLSFGFAFCFRGSLSAQQRHQHIKAKGIKLRLRRECHRWRQFRRT